jgi:4-amino-4-deoxy-L-arabinose transferase-like glycosyltransferase
VSQAGLTIPANRPAADPGWPALLLIWLLMGAAMLALAGRPAVQRTQEARVLETAREMLGRPWSAWLQPHVNAKLRLEKPPLAYWLAGASMAVFGVDEGAGRLPFVLAGWLTVGLILHETRRRLNWRAALLAAGVLLTSRLFFFHARLAETDVLFGLFLTAACIALWRGFEADALATGLSARAAGWFWAAALAMGLAAISKGPPPAILLLVGLAAVGRRWGVLWRFIYSGAPLGMLLIAAPWYLYIAHHFGTSVFFRELEVVGAGADHGKPFYYYIPALLWATAPWTGMVIVAAIAAILQWHTSTAARGGLLWTASLLVPLLLVGNKQDHYLLPLLPPLALLCGWWLDAMARRQMGLHLPRATGVIFLIMLLLLAAGGPALWMAGKRLAGSAQPADLVLGVTVLACALVAALFWLRLGLVWAVIVCMGSLVALLPLLTGAWLPSLSRHNSRTLAAAIRQQAGNGPYCFYGQRDSLTLCFALRSVVPLCSSADQLLAAAAGGPLWVITQEGKKDNAPPPLPDGFTQVMEPIETQGQTLRLWYPAARRVTPSTRPTP